MCMCTNPYLTLTEVILTHCSSCKQALKVNMKQQIQFVIALQLSKVRELETFDLQNVSNV